MNNINKKLQINKYESQLMYHTAHLSSSSSSSESEVSIFFFDLWIEIKIMWIKIILNNNDDNTFYLHLLNHLDYYSLLNCHST